MKRILFIILISFLMIVATACINGNNSKEIHGNGEPNDQRNIEKLINEMPFEVKLPSYIPFKVAHSYGFKENVEGPAEPIGLEITYEASNKEKYMKFGMYYAEIIFGNDDVENITLSNGDVAQLWDHDGIITINWKENEFNYTVIFPHEHRLHKDEILKVIDSVK